LLDRAFHWLISTQAAGRDTDAVRRAIGGCLAAEAPAAFVAATLRRRAELRTVVDCAGKECEIPKSARAEHSR